MKGGKQAPSGDKNTFISERSDDNRLHFLLLWRRGVDGKMNARVCICKHVNGGSNIKPVPHL